MVGREVIETLRKNVEDTGGYDKNYIFESMIARIAKDHPQKPQQ
jgi:hypothetical protein